MRIGFGISALSCTIDPWITLFRTLMICAPETFTFALQMTNSDKVRCSRACYHVLVMDGAEVAAALLCDVNQCPVCTCPRSELDRTDVSYPYRNTESVKKEVNAARSEHLDDDGEIKERHKDEVNKNHTRYHIRYCT
jgi:hypothetical protein